jgi:hypothetical protein
MFPLWVDLQILHALRKLARTPYPPSYTKRLSGCMVLFTNIYAFHRRLKMEIYQGLKLAFSSIKVKAFDFDQNVLA